MTIYVFVSVRMIQVKTRCTDLDDILYDLFDIWINPTTHCYPYVDDTNDDACVL
jgi:hypothetical protein